MPGMFDRPSILDDLPIAVWVAAVPDRTVVYTNKMFERIVMGGGSDRIQRHRSKRRSVSE